MVNSRAIICHGPFSQNLSLIPPFILRVASVQSKFPWVIQKYFSSVQQVTFWPKQLLLHLRRSDIKIAKEATDITREKSYELYFRCKVGDQDQIWGPKICCSSCSRTLAGWLKGTHKSVPFAAPVVWRELKGCLKDCYFA
jgi:hypothetical protein